MLLAVDLKYQERGFAVDVGSCKKAGLVLLCLLEALTMLQGSSPGANLYLAHPSRCCLVTED